MENDDHEPTVKPSPPSQPVHRSTRVWGPRDLSPDNQLHLLTMVSDDFACDIMHTGKRNFLRIWIAQTIADYYFRKFLVSNTLADIEWAIDLIEKEDRRVPSLISNLIRIGEYSRRKFQVTLDSSDIDRSIRAFHTALRMVPPDHQQRGRLVSCAIISIILDSKVLERPSQYETTLWELIDEFLSFPLEMVTTPKQLAAKACMMEVKYGGSKNVDNLAEAIQLYQQAIKALPPDGVDDLRAEFLYCLGGCFVTRFLRFSCIADINSAIDAFHGAAQIGTVTRETRAESLRSLGNAFLLRWGVLFQTADLDQSIVQTEESIQLRAPDDLKRAESLRILSGLFCFRYSLSGKVSDIDRAIDLLKESSDVDVLSVQLPLLLCMRSSTLPARNTKRAKAKALNDLDSLLHNMRARLKTLHIEHPQRALLLRMCSKMLIERCKYEGGNDGPGSLLVAIDLAEEAFVLIPPDDDVVRAEQSVWISKLWIDYDMGRKRFYPERLKEIYGISKMALRCKSAGAITRIDAAQLAGSTLSLTGMIARQVANNDPEYNNSGIFEESFEIFEEAFEIFEEGIALLRVLSPQHLQRGERQEVMGRSLAGLGAHAVAAGILAGKPASRYLATLELSRGVILGFSIDCRSTGNLRELGRTSPELLLKFNNLRSRIDAPTDISKVLGDIQTSKSLEEQSAIREQLKRQRINDVEELTKTLNEIRGLPGFEQFQLPPSHEDLINIAKDGPVVVMLCTTFRSDAIIVTSSSIRSIPLPKLFHPDTSKHMEILPSIIGGGACSYGPRNVKMEELLIWLWDAAVEPVMEELKAQGIVSPDPPDDASKLPHLWWIGVGRLAIFPFHAAGYHSRGSTRNTISNVISSYIPTLKALSYAREKALTFPSTGSSLLFVGMPETPGHASLTSDIEVGLVVSLLPEGVEAEVLSSPSVKETLEKLPSFNSVHFACHGFSDPRLHFNSHLLLHRHGDTTPGANRLTAGAISDINNESAQIAYLSACSTAKLRLGQQEDEALHIASAFQLAGFSHVLANMWESDDDACLKVSTEFYRNLFDGDRSASAAGHGKVSLAFHCAVKKLRDAHPKLPLLWSPFIHTGA